MNPWAFYEPPDFSKLFSQYCRHLALKVHIYHENLVLSICGVSFQIGNEQAEFVNNSSASASKPSPCYESTASKVSSCKHDMFKYMSVCLEETVAASLTIWIILYKFCFKTWNSEQACIFLHYCSFLSICNFANQWNVCNFFFKTRIFTLIHFFLCKAITLSQQQGCGVGVEESEGFSTWGVGVADNFNDSDSGQTFCSPIATVCFTNVRQRHTCQFKQLDASTRDDHTNLHTFTQEPFQISSVPWAHHATYTLWMQPFGACITEISICSFWLALSLLRDVGYATMNESSHGSSSTVT